MTYVAMLVLLVCVGLGFVGWTVTAQAYDEWLLNVPLSGGFTWAGVFLVDVICVIVALIFFRVLYCDSKLAICEHHISKPGLFGRQIMLWKDVLSVDLYPGVLCVFISESQSIRLKLALYRNADELVEASHDLIRCNSQ